MGTYTRVNCILYDTREDVAVEISANPERELYPSGPTIKRHYTFRIRTGDETDFMLQLNFSQLHELVEQINKQTVIANSSEATS